MVTIYYVRPTHICGDTLLRVWWKKKNILTFSSKYEELPKFIDYFFYFYVKILWAGYSSKKTFRTCGILLWGLLVTGTYNHCGKCRFCDINSFYPRLQPRQSLKVSYTLSQLIPYQYNKFHQNPFCCFGVIDEQTSKQRNFHIYNIRVISREGSYLMLIH